MNFPYSRYRESGDVGTVADVPSLVSLPENDRMQTPDAHDNYSPISRE